MLLPSLSCLFQSKLLMLSSQQCSPVVKLNSSQVGMCVTAQAYVQPALKLLLSPLSAPDAPCSDLQGLLSGLLPDAQILSSSSRDMVWSPGTARLVASRSGWFPGPAQPLAGEEWLQVMVVNTLQRVFVFFLHVDNIQ